MRWPVFVIFAFAVLAMQLSLRNVFTLQSLSGVSPDFVACLCVFVSLFAHRSSALWSCWILGLLMDLAPPERSYYIVGEHALGYVFGGLVILQLRTMVFRRRAVTIGFLTFVFVLAASMVAVFLLSVRSWYTPETFQSGGALGELARRFGIALYSGLLAIPTGWFLGATISLWGFQSGIPRRTGGW